jgi:ATP-dependent Lhr-like helicase
VPVDPLDRFSPAAAAWFRGSFGAPTAAQAAAWRAIATGGHTLVIAPTGSGKTLAAFLWGIDRLLAEAAPGTADGRTAAVNGTLDGWPAEAACKTAGGKTTAAPLRRCRLLYISPLKALAADIERNLREPLAGIRAAAAAAGQTAAPVSVAIRSGDTPAAERRRFARFGADILITTPESLYLLLTSAARSALEGVETVIVDEIHSLAGTKRGAHLAVSLERLDARLARPAQRIGLSATVRPPAAVGEYLAAGRTVAIIAPPTAKAWDLSVQVPVPDLGDLQHAPASTGTTPSADLAPAAGTEATPAAPRASIWPHVTERLVDLIASRRSTIVFVNSRQVAERLSSRVNEVWESRALAAAETNQPDGGREGLGSEPNGEREEPRPAGGREGPAPTGSRPTPPMAQPWPTAVSPAGNPVAGDPPAVRRQRLPANYIGFDSVAAGAAPVARAHHGSMSHEQRHDIEEDLKAGRLKAVVATSSLELGIDMGAVDLVVQVEAPGSVASGLQRIGRAGHQVGAVSEGVFFPKYLGDLLAMTVVVEQMRAGQIEVTTPLRNPLDVLAQQIVAMAAMDSWTADELEVVLRRAAPFAQLSHAAYEAVLDLLSGRYPSEAFAELRPRLDWDRATGRLTGRRGAQRLAVTSGGTIPDRGLYGVFLADGPAVGRRVGELDEEMVFESRVGDTITLGSSSWLITAITNDQVLVAPAPGAPGRLPFWKGDGLGRRAELGQAIGAFVRELQAVDDKAARDRLGRLGLDTWAADSLLGYLTDQRAAAGVVPDDRTIVVESFRDELGDWRIVVCCPYGGRVNTPWSLLIAASLRQAYGADGLDIQAMATDDGIVFRLPDTASGWDSDAPAVWARDGLTSHLVTDPGRVEDLVREQLANSSHFAVRFREAAARALLLPRRQPGRRQPLWQLRNRSAQLLSVASQYPEFPIMLEASRECLRDDFELDALADLMAKIARREIRIEEVATAQPSPFARTVLFNYVGLFMYESDTPLAELRAAALTVDPTLLAELLGGGAGLDPADLLDPAVLTRLEAELQRLVPSRQARTSEDVHDLIRRLGPLSAADLAARTLPEQADQTAIWLAGLAAAGQIATLPAAAPGRTGESRLAPAADRWVAAVDAGWIAAGLGLPQPGGPAASRAADPDESLDRLLFRYARSHAPFTADECARWLALPAAALRERLRRLAATGRLAAGNLRPAGWAPPRADAADNLLSGADKAADECGGAESGLGLTPPPFAAETSNASSGAESGPQSAVFGPAVLDVYCDPDILALLRRRSLAKLRSETEPAPQIAYARFLPAWHGVGAGRGIGALSRAIEQLAGAPIPASSLESFVLPARVADYEPGFLDELLAAGAVVWCGRGETAGGDGWVSLIPADLLEAFPAAAGKIDFLKSAADDAVSAQVRDSASALSAEGVDWLLRQDRDNRSGVSASALGSAQPPGPNLGVGAAAGAEAAFADGSGAGRGAGELDQALLSLLAAGGAFRLPELAALAAARLGRAVTTAETAEACWRLAWAGLLSTDTFAPLRHRLGQVSRTVRSRRPPPRPTSHRPRLAYRRAAAAWSAAPDSGGRWFLVPGQITPLGQIPLPGQISPPGQITLHGQITPPGQPLLAPDAPSGPPSNRQAAPPPAAGPGASQPSLLTPSTALPSNGGFPAAGAAVSAGRPAAATQPDRPAPRPPESAAVQAERAIARAEVLLDRYGVLSRGAVQAEDCPGGFAARYRRLSVAEEQGRVRRGYFVDRLGGSQFATAGAIDRLRAAATPPAEPAAIVLAAADPANPYGAALPWPPRPGDNRDDAPAATNPAEAGATATRAEETNPAKANPTETGATATNPAAAGPAARGHRPSRKAGALVVLVDGALAAFVERGGRTVMAWPVEPESLAAAASALADVVHAGRLDSLTVESVNGRPVLSPGRAAEQSGFAAALQQAGFILGPHGLRLRR